MTRSTRAPAKSTRSPDYVADPLRQTDCAFVFISHDIWTVRQIAHQVGVMYLGRMVEIGEAGNRAALAQACLHAGPLRRGAGPRLDPCARRTYIAPDPGDLEEAFEGCPYRARCPFADAVCETRPAFVHQGGRDVACHHVGVSPARNPTTEAHA
jgi:peptide/nickel transport system ATP-binding protein